MSLPRNIEAQPTTESRKDKSTFSKYKMVIIPGAIIGGTAYTMNAVRTGGSNKPGKNK